MRHTIIAWIPGSSLIGLALCTAPAAAENIKPGPWEIQNRMGGSGDMGNDGVHDLDIARWGLGVETHPSRIAAIGGKGVACWLAARATGLSNRESLGIGTLMNARGLMELIIINIGLQRGIITPALFATLVIMAVVTTLMASPLFELLVGRQRPATEA